jgi:hypothetical protein
VTKSKLIEDVRVQVSARESLLRPETRNLKSGTRHPTLDPRLLGVDLAQRCKGAKAK